MMAPALPPITAPMIAPRAVDPVALPTTAPTAPPVVAPTTAPFSLLFIDAQPTPAIDARASAQPKRTRAEFRKRLVIGINASLMSAMQGLSIRASRVRFQFRMTRQLREVQALRLAAPARSSTTPPATTAPATHGSIEWRSSVETFKSPTLSTSSRVLNDPPR